jgi:GNAT superfamily N-acetyltransferase
VKVVALTEETLPAWRSLFDACGCACFCRYWHFEGTKNDWLARCAERPGENRDEQVALVRSHAEEARGLLALDGAAALGWMKLVPRARLPKLLRQGAYRPLALGPDEGVWAIGCLLVHPHHRRRGVARALVRAADDHVRTWEDPRRPCAIDAYPRGRAPGVAPAPLHDEEAWTGTPGLFAGCGFVRVAGESAYPVMRKVVR